MYFIYSFRLLILPDGSLSSGSLSSDPSGHPKSRLVEVTGLMSAMWEDTEPNGLELMMASTSRSTVSRTSSGTVCTLHRLGGYSQFSFSTFKVCPLI